MHRIKPLPTPSTQEKNRIVLRRASVADCIFFAGVDPESEEETLTMFLTRLQDPADFINPDHMTVQDRWTAKVWYWIQTSTTFERQISLTCACGAEHTHYTYDYRTIFQGFRSITGKPERPLEFHGEKYVVRCHDGLDAVALERLAMTREDAVAAHGPESGTVRGLEVQMDIAFVLRAVGVRRENFTSTAEYESAEAKLLESLTDSDYIEFRNLVINALDEMAHGIPLHYSKGRYACLAELPCPVSEVTTLARVPFRVIGDCVSLHL